MSILIEGLEKPTDCGLCPFEDFGYCNVKGERNTSESGIDTDCPLIEVADRKTENSSEKPNNCEEWQDWKDRMWAEAIVTEPTTEDCSTVDKDINVRSKDEPQTENLYTDKYGDVWEWRGDAWYCISGCETCKHGDEEWDSEACDGCCENNDHYEPKDKTQTERSE